MMTAARLLELGDCNADDAAEERDRKVDLPKQKNEDDAVGEHRHARHLHDDVVEVDRSEEVLGGEPEEDDDERQSDGDRQAAEVPTLEVLPDPGAEALLGWGEVECRAGRGLGLGRHDGPSTSTGSSSSIEIPETFVGVPAVIACTTSCCV